MQHILADSQDLFLGLRTIGGRVFGTGATESALAECYAANHVYYRRATSVNVSRHKYCKRIHPIHSARSGCDCGYNTKRVLCASSLLL